jgi:hypothetical protein
VLLTALIEKSSVLLHLFSLNFSLNISRGVQNWGRAIFRLTDPSIGGAGSKTSDFPDRDNLNKNHYC